MNAIDRIPTFKAGLHRDREYTPADLDDMVANFTLASTGDDPVLRVPLVIGHDEGQELLARSDLPAAGWVTKLYRDGDDLYVDADDVADLPADLIRARRYRKVSAEVYDEPPAGMEHCKGKVLRRVALLGGDIPEVKGLGDIPMPRQSAARFSESSRLLDAYYRPMLLCGHAESRGAGVWEVFSEVRFGMQRQKLLDELGKRGVDVSLLTDSVSDAQLAEILRAVDSAQQAADADRDGEADSTQYAPPQPVAAEAVPPVESQKDGQRIPEDGFAEEDSDEVDGIKKYLRRARRDEKDAKNSGEDGETRRNIEDEERDQAAQYWQDLRNARHRERNMAEGDREPTPENVRREVDRMTAQRQRMRPESGRPGLGRPRPPQERPPQGSGGRGYAEDDGRELTDADWEHLGREASRDERMRRAINEDVDPRSRIPSLHGQKGKSIGAIAGMGGDQSVMRRQARATGRVPRGAVAGRDFADRPQQAQGDDPKAIFAVLVRAGIDPATAKQMALQISQGGGSDNSGMCAVHMSPPGPDRPMAEGDEGGLYSPKGHRARLSRAQRTIDQYHLGDEVIEANRAQAIRENQEIREQAGRVGRHGHPALRPRSDMAEGRTDDEMAKRHKGGRSEQDRVADAHEDNRRRNLYRLRRQIKSGNNTIEHQHHGVIGLRRAQTRKWGLGDDDPTIRAIGDNVRDAERRIEEGDYAEGDRDVSREERIRTRQRRLVAAQRGQLDGFGETRVRRHSEAGEGRAMAGQGNSGAPSVVAVIERAVAGVAGGLKKQVEAGLKQIAEANAKVEKFAEQRAADERAVAVDSFLESMSMVKGEERLTPAQREIERLQGIAADNKAVVRTFSEGGKEVNQTSYDLWREGIKARPKLNLFSEQVGTDGEGNRPAGGDAEERKIRGHYQSFSESWKKGGVKTADRLVEMFNNERKVRPDATAEEFLTQ